MRACRRVRNVKRQEIGRLKCKAKASQLTKQASTRYRTIRALPAAIMAMLRRLRLRVAENMKVGEWGAEKKLPGRYETDGGPGTLPDKGFNQYAKRGVRNAGGTGKPRVVGRCWISRDSKS